MRSLLLVAIFILFFFGCHVIDEQEIERIESPDGKVDAVLIVKNGGATTSLTYEVFIVPRGGVVRKKSLPVFIADKVINLRAKWLRAKLIEISYTDARIFKYKNFWQHRDVEQFKYEVKIIETELPAHDA